MNFYGEPPCDFMENESRWSFHTTYILWACMLLTQGLVPAFPIPADLSSVSDGQCRQQRAGKYFNFLMCRIIFYRLPPVILIMVHLVEEILSPIRDRIFSCNLEGLQKFVQSRELWHFVLRCQICQIGMLLNSYVLGGKLFLYSR